MGWTSAIVYNLMSGINVSSFKAKSYLDQGCFKHVFTANSSRSVIKIFAECCVKRLINT